KTKKTRYLGNIYQWSTSERKFSAKNYADLVFNSDYEFEEQLKEFHIKKKISYQQKLESLDSQVTVFAVNKKLNSN
ncbi:19539_t:CDS:2, partial [Entrophospora sp. SA101]